MIETVAVIPGFSFKSGLLVLMIVVYVTTLLVVVGELRTCWISPVKTSPWKASTENRTAWPSFTRPMSASSTGHSTCILVRSLATLKRMGVWKPAATV